MRNRLGTLLVPTYFYLKICSVNSYTFFPYLNMKDCASLRIYFFLLWLTDELIFKTFQLWKTFDVLFVLIFICCRRGNKRFDAHFWRIRPVYFQSNERNVAACEEENGGENVCFPPESALCVDNIFKKLFPSFYPDLACKQLCFSPRKRFKEEKRKYCEERTLIPFWLSVDCTDCD